MRRMVLMTIVNDNDYKHCMQGSMRSELSDLHSLVVPKHKLTRGIFAIFGSLQKVIFGAMMSYYGELMIGPCVR